MGTSPSSSPDRPSVLYIGGSGRSGSTLLESLLGEMPGVVVLGEVAHLWERGVRLDELCACGEHFSACPFWSEVGELAFGGWSRVDLERVAFLKDAVDRQRRMLRTARRRPAPEVHVLAQEYADLFVDIYRAARETSGARVVIDSSKVAPTALALSHHDELDLRILHIVRDSRGVAFSWSKQVARPETGGTEDMPRLTGRQSTQLWLSHNLALSAVTHRGVPIARIRYEDLVRDAAGTIDDVWRRLDLPPPAVLPMIDDHTVELHPTHSVAGNPMRFRTGTTRLQPDTEWREAMDARERRIVTAMSLPLLKFYGYV
ncbi:sulfotransferase [Nocardioides sp. 1609]|uniref:sulfotransferase n=1 Tax=Nocardioides sp. 1609 TaxID=2508327 RepID=UPI001ADBC8EC|nr:sulfotransferase [Nocardioides sp. 1609]